MVDAAVGWLETDGHFRLDDDCYRGGKLVDDAVDTMICLATALSYARGCAHVWQDPGRLDDGHIIGPGCPQGVPWVAASKSATEPADERLDA